jgi:hypothetical protein
MCILEEFLKGRIGFWSFWMKILMIGNMCIEWECLLFGCFIEKLVCICLCRILDLCIWNDWIMNLLFCCIVFWESGCLLCFLLLVRIMILNSGRNYLLVLEWTHYSCNLSICTFFVILIHFIIVCIIAILLNISFYVLLVICLFCRLILFLFFI